MGHTPVRLGLSGRNSGKILERPRKRSQSGFLEFPLSRVRLGCPKPYNSRHLRLPEHFQNYLLPVRLGALLFSEVVPERASQSRSWNSQQYWGYLGKRGREGKGTGEVPSSAPRFVQVRQFPGGWSSALSSVQLRLLCVDGPPGGPLCLHHPVLVRLSAWMVRLDGPPWSWMVRLAGPPGWSALVRLVRLDGPPGWSALVRLDGPLGWSAWLVRVAGPPWSAWSAWMVRLDGPPGPLGWSACRVRLVGPPGQPRRGVGTAGVHWRALMQCWRLKRCLSKRFSKVGLGLVLRFGGLFHRRSLLLLLLFNCAL